MGSLSIAVIQVLVLLGSAEHLVQQGEEVHCVQDRAHLIKYDIGGEPNDGSSMDSIKHAVISMMPSPKHSAQCTPLGFNPSGDKQFCYGVNEDSSCAAAKTVIPIKDGFDCKDCFVSGSADAHYALNYSMTKLYSVEVGLHNIELRAAASVHTHLSGSKAVASGTLQMPGTDKTYKLVDRLVGCPVCVKVTIVIGIPTSLDYNLNVDGEADVEAGALLDISLGNNVVSWDHEDGWKHETHDPQVKVTPIIDVAAKATAKLDLDVKTSIQVDVDKIIWYHLNLNPALPTTVKFDGGIWPLGHDQVCISGDASFSMNQEANLDDEMFHVKHHWGPNNLYTWSKSGIIHGCKDIHKASSTDSIVV